MTKEDRLCQNCKNSFSVEPEDFTFYEKIEVPPPTFCPECRLIRRLTFRNERALYRRECVLCKKSIISVYSTDKPYTIYCTECYQSDQWDPLQYGSDVDFSKPFFAQFRELLLSIPRPSFYQKNAVNSPYANYVENVKDVYLSFSTLASENVFYSKNVDSSSHIFDSTDVTNSEHCYEVILSEKNYDCRYAYFSRNCMTSSFIYDCVNCRDCMLCSGLRNRSYCILNKQLSKEEYERRLKEFHLDQYSSFTHVFHQFEELCFNALRKSANLINCVSSSGDDLRDSESALFSFGAYGLQNVKYAFRCLFSKDAMDIVNSGRNELVYEFISGGATNGRMVRFVTNSGVGLNEVEYSDFCFSSSYLFGCAGMRNGEYCILNKRYNESEWRDLRTRVVQHMIAMPYVDACGHTYSYGEFFPYAFSPFAYNETLAQELFPLSRADMVGRGFVFKESEERQYAITQQSSDLPDSIHDCSDDILTEVILCEHASTCSHQCTHAYRIHPEELQYYKRMVLPIPRLCPNCRYCRRLNLRNPLRLWKRRCMCNTSESRYKNTLEHFHGSAFCPNEFATSYAPNRKEIIYCERCYQAEVS